MNREEIVLGLRDEIERLTRVVELLEQGGEAKDVSSTPTPAKKRLQTPVGRRGKHSPEARARMAEAARKRWKLRKTAVKKAEVGH